MSSFGGALGPADFDEPQSNDNTSAPAMPSQVQPDKASGLAAAMMAAMKRKKKKGTAVGRPHSLQMAMSSARRAKQSSHKYG